MPRPRYDLAAATGGSCCALCTATGEAEERREEEEEEEERVKGKNVLVGRAVSAALKPFHWSHLRWEVFFLFFFWGGLLFFL